MWERQLPVCEVWPILGPKGVMGIRQGQQSWSEDSGGRLRRHGGWSREVPRKGAGGVLSPTCRVAPSGCPHISGGITPTGMAPSWRESGFAGTKGGILGQALVLLPLDHFSSCPLLMCSGPLQAQALESSERVRLSPSASPQAQSWLIVPKPHQGSCLLLAAPLKSSRRGLNWGT